MKKDEEIKLVKIGEVKNNIEKVGRLNWKEIASEIIINEELVDSLSGLEEYSHIVVIFWMHLAKKKFGKIKVPYAPNDLEEKGVLSTRVPSRPNPIGLSIVELLSVKNNILRVKGLDALNNTPVLDIKPYTGHRRDIVKDFSVPEWEK